MGTNYFVVGYDHPDAEREVTLPLETWRNVQIMLREAWSVGFRDGREAEDLSQIEEDHPLFARAKNLIFPPGRLHIGKSSFGWCFGLAVHEGIQSLADWERVWATPGVHIEDEYGRPFSVEEMRDRITKRSWKSKELSAEEKAGGLHQNHGLSRHTYNARIPDEGPSATYDLCYGWFR
jgi:hypothetical protein